MDVRTFVDVAPEEAPYCEWYAVVTRNITPGPLTLYVPKFSTTIRPCYVAGDIDWDAAPLYKYESATEATAMLAHMLTVNKVLRQEILDDVR